MSKQYTRALWGISGVLLLAVFAIAFYRQDSPTVANPLPSPSSDKIWPEWAIADSIDKKFFTRYIDSITYDTMYFVCRMTPEGDTIPDKVYIEYDNDSICSFRYYLNNNGDTVLLDYFHTEIQPSSHDTALLLMDSMFQKSRNSVLNSDEQKLVDDIANYLEQIEQHNTIIDTTSIQTPVKKKADSIAQQPSTFNSIVVHEDHNLK